ncbi:GntR family transcriptional regulator [Mesobacillus subterraneus]|uniref:GntR family transcriptional regulator n=1 Tax=Mesobacillus subterraneus TaxID=285983 RepID=UPI00203B2941|nr:GntR family transcriptional regulator [Mesobacillus subterraneus]MCM3572443.1 GntR family transcriptional regulator [Mesobacillus subterraneus]
MVEIDMENPIPYHVQIKNLLRKEILEGRYKEKIPSERELMNRFSVSRTTVREAITHLVNDGVLTKVHGKGTYISPKRPIEEWLNSLHSLTETVRKMGMKPGSVLLNSGVMTKPRYFADKIGEKEFFTIERLRTADGDPIAIERHYYSREIGEQLSKHDLETAAIYELIEKKLGIELHQAEQFISCKRISDMDAENLGIPKGINVLCVERLIKGADGKPIELYISFYKPDMYVFRIKTKRQKYSS